MAKSFRRSAVVPVGMCVVALAVLTAACSAKSGDAAEETPRSLPHVTTSTLPANAPDEWHRLALYGNWDFVDADAWRTIVTRPDCDRATALAIFWKLSPEYHVQFADRDAVPAINRDDYDLIALIRERWRNGAYTRSELAFDPDADAWPLDIAALRRQYGERVDTFLPASMRVKLTGRRLDAGPSPPRAAL